jgi:hypothetical protein
MVVILRYVFCDFPVDEVFFTHHLASRLFPYPYALVGSPEQKEQ